MKKLFILVASLLALSSCEDFLTLDPQGETNTDNYYDTDINAITAVNGIYDLIGASEGQGPDWQWMDHHYEFFFGSMTSDDSEKGSKPGDKTDLIQLIEWNFDGNFTISKPFWIHGFWGVSRANGAIDGLRKSTTLSPELKERLLGESYFLRGYYYFYLLRHFGALPLFDGTPPTSSYGKIPRATLHETFEFIVADFERAAEALPNKSDYAPTDLGRATRGAALSFLSRVLMYQAGVDAEVSDTRAIWDRVYSATDEVITSGEYSLVADFGSMFEAGTKNCSESIFEIQTSESGIDGGLPESTGTGYCNFQGNRAAKDGANTGWGFNNPTQNLVDAFDPSDPRLSSTVYGIGFNGGVLYGAVQNYDRAQQSTNYLNRKAALSATPATPKGTQFNVILMRLADVYLMRAEAAYNRGDEAGARADVNFIRSRARHSTLCKGFNEGSADSYPTPVDAVNLPDISASGADLQLAIWKERRLELAMENLRTWDLIRQGRFLDTIERVKDLDRESNGSDDELRYPGIKASCMTHCLGAEHGAKVPVPVLSIPNTEVTAWGLTQNPL